MDATSNPGATALQVKVTLLGVSKPPVWRRLLVADEEGLDHLHAVIQLSMGWSDYHMHVFATEAGEYGVPDPELGFLDERRVALLQLLRHPGDRIRYTYDFGDAWEHEIVLEKMIDADPGQVYPMCVAGKGACPPEDCGSVWGYARLRAVLADPSDEEHSSMLEWLELERASDFDAAAFDVDAVNESLGHLIAVR
ncbi:MAG: plasmid pRiA4b ORF-3 family protein [Solirubrobacteraceae bacterium]